MTTNFHVNVCRHTIGDPKFENFKINDKENNVMTTYKRNERHPDGTGVPDPPKMTFGEQRRPDPLDQLKNFMVNKHGEAEGIKLLKLMSAEEAIETLELIKNNENETGIAFKQGNFETYSMPKMKF